MEKQQNKNSLTSKGLIITKRRLDLNMSQRQLAQAIGASEVYLCRILYGLRSGDKYMEKIIKELDLDKEMLNKA